MVPGDSHDKCAGPHSGVRKSQTNFSGISDWKTTELMWQLLHSPEHDTVSHFWVCKDWNGLR